MLDPDVLLDEPGRHGAAPVPQGGPRLDGPRPGPRLLVRQERHRRDRVGPMALLAAPLEDGCDVLRERHLGLAGRARCARLGPCGDRHQHGGCQERGTIRAFHVQNSPSESADNRDQYPSKPPGTQPYRAPGRAGRIIALCRGTLRLRGAGIARRRASCRRLSRCGDGAATVGGEAGSGRRNGRKRDRWSTPEGRSRVIPPADTASAPTRRCPPGLSPECGRRPDGARPYPG